MKTIIFSLLILLTSQNVFALSGDDFEWRVASNKRGVKIFKAKKHKSGLVPIKVETILPYPPSRVLAVIADTDRKKEWVPDLRFVRSIDGNDEYDKTEYSIYNSPWPFTDRSFLVRIKSIINKKDKSLFIKLNSVLSEKAPINPKLVRGHTYNGDVILRNDGKGNAYFQVMFLTDFKGNITNWIVNMVQQGWPKKMIKKLKRQIEREDITVPKHYKYLD